MGTPSEADPDQVFERFEIRPMIETSEGGAEPLPNAEAFDRAQLGQAGYGCHNVVAKFWRVFGHTRTCEPEPLCDCKNQLAATQLALVLQATISDKGQRFLTFDIERVFLTRNAGGYESYRLCSTKALYESFKPGDMIPDGSRLISKTWSLYGRGRDGCAEHICDRPTYEQVAEIYSRITGRKARESRGLPGLYVPNPQQALIE